VIRRIRVSFPGNAGRSSAWPGQWNSVPCVYRAGDLPEFREPS
jgi:hypothetical protein